MSKTLEELQAEASGLVVVPTSIADIHFAPYVSLESTSVSGLVWTEPEPEAWLVSGLIPRKAPTALVAPGGTGKSYLTLGLSYHVALGLDFMGLATTPGGVLILSAEDDRSIFHQRVRWMLDAFATVSAQRAEFGRSVHLFDYTSEVPNLGDALRAFVETKAALLEKQGTPLVLFVVDPLLYFLPRDSDGVSDNQGATEVMGFVRRIARQTGAAGVLLAHTNKASQTPGRKRVETLLDPNALLGAGAFMHLARGAVSLASLYQQEAEGYGLECGSDFEYVLARVTKGSYSDVMGRRAAFRRNDNGVLTFHGWVNDEGSVEVENAPPSTRSLILEALAQHPGPLTHADITSGIPAEYRPKRDTVQRKLREMAAEGLLKVDADAVAAQLPGSARGKREVKLNTYALTHEGSAELGRIRNGGLSPAAEAPVTWQGLDGDAPQPKPAPAVDDALLIPYRKELRKWRFKPGTKKRDEVYRLAEKAYALNAQHPALSVEEACTYIKAHDGGGISFNRAVQATHDAAAAKISATAKG